MGWDGMGYLWGGEGKRVDRQIIGFWIDYELESGNWMRLETGTRLGFSV